MRRAFAVIALSAVFASSANAAPARSCSLATKWRSKNATAAAT